MSRPASEYGPSWIHGVCWTLLVLFALLEMSCGSRKAAVKVEDSTVNETVKSTSEGQVKKEESTSDHSKSQDTQNNVEENLKKKITEVYNENGTLKERITELEKVKSDKSSSKTNESLKTKINRIDSVFNAKNIRKIVIKEHTKDKVTEADNDSLYWTIGGVLLGVALLYGIYRYMTRRIED